MKPLKPLDLGRRERQIMEIIYRRGQATVSQVLEALPDPPSYSSVRAMLNMLEDKGHLTHCEQGRKFVYQPTVAQEKVRKSALQNLLSTFFGGSSVQAVASLLEMDKANLSDQDLERLSTLIDQARKEGR